MSAAAPKGVALVLLAMAVCKSTSAPTYEEDISASVRGDMAMEGGYFEGDITTKEYPEIGRSATSDDKRLWPDGVIPYTTDSTLGSKDNLALIRDAMDSIEGKTCIRFVPRKDHKDFVNIKSKQGCYSALGREGGEQPLSLGRGCLSKGTIIHELLHAVGFYHEHTRPDRDDYVDVFMKNVRPDMKRQFTKIDPAKIRSLTPFDYNSIMLYGSDAFSRRPNVHTMVAKDGSLLTPVSKKPGLSEADIARINALYKCDVQ